METSGAQLSRWRQFLFWALVVVWFSEMLLWGLRSLAEGWGTSIWLVPTPEDPELATALYMTRAFHAPDKAALGVLAVFALRSRDAFARTALFASMALVPPLNVAFQFRAQGFPVQPTMIGTTLSILLWVSFFLFPERSVQPKQNEGRTSSRWDRFRYTWFSLYAVVLTALGLLSLFAPRTHLALTFPCSEGLLAAHEAQLSPLVISDMGIGTHLMALGVAMWFATVRGSTNRTLRHAATSSAIVHTGLICALPLRLIAVELGGRCAASSIAIVFLPLLVGWLVYAAIEFTEVFHHGQNRARKASA
ncbi:MAG TPA: hypothetical protein VFU01_07700 [Gemmatimonadaceae bacterium]|nr:hypothetical protein [Gemmatimonadaceae bacterium]